MRRATILLRDSLTYRRELFTAGFGQLGYSVLRLPPRDVAPGDVLVMWNRTRGHETLAGQWERKGGTVMVAENGYLPWPPGPKQFALSIARHNGAGRTPLGEVARYLIPVEPWRADGDHILILPQRGIGSPGVAMPLNWPIEIRRRIAGRTRRRVVLRQHPGNSGRGRPLADDLKGAWCAVTWGSGAAIKALVAGVPVFHDMPKWIGASAARRLECDIEQPYLGERAELVKRISWGQWGDAEIASGEAFRALLAC